VIVRGCELNRLPGANRHDEGNGRSEYRGQVNRAPFSIAETGTLDHFLLERYSAYTYRKGTARRFEVAHAPWTQVRADVELIETSLIRSVSPALHDMELIGANFSPGVRDVAISAPQKISEMSLIRG
jgi:uncharacterized protein YqjF (DUF2071 family)